MGPYFHLLGCSYEHKKTEMYTEMADMQLWLLKNLQCYSSSITLGDKVSILQEKATYSLGSSITTKPRVPSKKTTARDGRVNISWIINGPSLDGKLHILETS